jgi:hypothetical protein
MKYVVSNANEMLAVTGWGIDDFVITRKKFVLPGQRVTRFNVTPYNYVRSLFSLYIYVISCM